VPRNPLHAGATAHTSTRATTTKAYSEDVVDWLHDASLRLLEARLARAVPSKSSGPHPRRHDEG
jgi:hypothetical protein